MTGRGFLNWVSEPVVSGDQAGVYLLEAIDQIHRDLGFPEYTASFVPGTNP